jgi:uncharacterized protein (DUF1330 family)
MKPFLMIVLLAFTFSIAPAATPPADAGPPVTHVIVLDVGKDMPKFLELNKRMGEIAQKYGDAGKARFWINAIAGPESGTVIVTVEYPSMVAFAQSTAKVQASPEYQKFMADAQATSIKQISNSIVVEMKPG